MRRGTLNAKEAAELRFDRRTLDRFAASLELSPHSVVSYKKFLAYFFEYLSGRGIERPEREHVAAYMEAMLASGKKATTAHNYLAAVRAFFRWTEGEGLYPDVTEGMPLPRFERAPSRKALTGAQIKEVLLGIDRGSLKGLRDYAILVLMLTTGLSALEVSHAKVGDVRKCGRGYVLHVQDGDGERREAVSVPPRVMEALTAYLEARGEANPDLPLFSGVSPRNKGKSGHMTPGSVGRVVKEALRGAGFDDVMLSAQSLKISAVKLALQRGERLEDVQRFARHKHIRTTFLYEPSGSAQARE
ncbi:MAG: site-specific integrase [Synergistaceae bacterium]|nr:site-specific integrase [Synergistaceae bacterium]